MKQFWLLKSEPETFSIRDLQEKGSTLWDGVRNYQARNFLCEMKPGDEAVIYHSNATPPGAAGLATILQPAVADPAQFDPESDYFDAKATTDNPRWFCPDVGFKEEFARFVPLAELRTLPELEAMALLRKGSRLSVTPLTREEYAAISRLGRRKT